MNHPTMEDGNMEEGDIVYIDYDIKIKETGELYQTTREAVAKKNDIFDEEKKYTPIPMVVGQGEGPSSFHDAIKEMKVGDKKEFEVKSEDAYGERKPELIERASIRTIMKLPQFREKESYPVPGMQIMMKGKMGQITTIGAGRVRVDFNHPLAGKTLEYNVELIKCADEDEKKIAAIFEMYYKNDSKPTITIEDNNVKILLPETCKYDPSWVQQKFMIVAFLRRHLGEKNFQLIEEYKAPVAVEKESEHEHSEHCNHDPEAKEEKGTENGEEAGENE